MFRKLLTIFFLLGLLTSAGAWVAQARSPIVLYHSKLPDNYPTHLPGGLPKFLEEPWSEFSTMKHRSLPGEMSTMLMYGVLDARTKTVSRSIGYAVLHRGELQFGIGAETLITDDVNNQFFEFHRSYQNSNLYWIPLWSIALACALASGLLTVLPVLRRSKRAKRGQCLQCGYDLRGSSERCPECGTEFEQKARVSQEAVAQCSRPRAGSRQVGFHSARGSLFNSLFKHQ